MKFTLEFTKNGLPALWEEGGGLSNRGSSQIVANADGSAKNPIHVRKKGHLACAQHGLFIVRPGDYVIQATRYRDEYEINIYKIEKIEGENAMVSTVEGQPEHLAEAVEAAKKKSQCYHCRHVHFDRGTVRVQEIIRVHTYPNGNFETLGRAGRKYFAVSGVFSGKEISRKSEDVEWFRSLEEAEEHISHWDTLFGHQVLAEKEVKKADREKLKKAFPYSSDEYIASEFYRALWRENGKITFDQFLEKRKPLPR